VRISCPTGLLQGGVADALVRFLAKQPRVRIALDATNRRVDVVDEGLDIALRVRKPPLEDSDLAMRTFGPDEVIPRRQSRIDCRAWRTANARRHCTNADAFDGERRRALDLALPRRGRRARRTDTLAAPLHGRSVHAAACGAARDWCSPSPASPRRERSGGRRAHPTAAVAQGSRRNRARGFSRRGAEWFPQCARSSTCSRRLSACPRASSGPAQPPGIMFLRAHSEKTVKPPGTRAFAAAMRVCACGPK